LIGRGNADQFTGTTTTDDSTDIIVDAATGDNDTLTFTSSAAIPALRVINVENVNVTINSLAADAVDATNYAGVLNLTVTRGDLTIGGATLTGEKTATFSGVNAANTAAVTVGAGTEAVVVTQVTRAGVTVNADEASGSVTVTGAATVNAAGAGAGDTVTVNLLSDATQDARAVTVTTGAETVTIGAFTGVITVTANSAETVTLANASGGATVTAEAGATTTDGIDVRGIDSSGATITTGSYASTAAGQIDIGGTTASTDRATISAAGTIDLDVGIATGAVDLLTLQSNGAAVTYNIASTNGVATTYTGESDVTIAGDAGEFSGKTATTFAAIDLNAGTPGAIDADSWTVTKVDLGFDNQGNAIAVANNQVWEITADQTTGLDYDFATTTIGNLTVVAGDDNGTNPAVGTISVAAFNAAAGSATTSGTVTIEASIANFTATSAVIGAAQTLVVTGDEDVTLGAVTALAVNAANSSGIINMTAEANVATVTTGSGADVLILNGAIVHTVSTGSGNDNITVTDTSATSTIDAGLGNDTLTLTQTTAYVVAGGEGNDNFRTGADINAVVLGGNGTDTFTVTTGTLDFSTNTMFALNSIEAFNLTAATGATTISSAQLAANSTIAITADGDQLTVAVGTAAGSLDASGITIATGSTAVLNYTGSTGANVMTGGVQNETFQGGRGADSVEGGDGTDTFVLEDTATTETGSANSSTGMVANLSASAVTAATIISNVAGTFLGGSVTSVASGTATHLYDENAALNASVVDSLSSIENVTGGSGADYIVGSVGDNALSGAAGADYIDGGAGDDTITGGAGDDTLIGGVGSDTIVFSSTSTTNGSDTITGFVSTTDKINVDAFGAETALTTATSATFTTAVGKVYFYSATDAGAALSVETASTVATVVSGSATITDAAVTAFLIVVDQTEGNSAIYQWNNTTAGAEIITSELVLLGTIDAALVSGDVIFS
jgi:Ca2+-binding RTX toxin-like protein